MRDKFDYEGAREHLWECGLDPDELPDKKPADRDEFLKKQKIDPEQFKSGGRKKKNL